MTVRPGAGSAKPGFCVWSPWNTKRGSSSSRGRRQDLDFQSKSEGTMTGLRTMRDNAVRVVRRCTRPRKTGFSAVARTDDNQPINVRTTNTDVRSGCQTRGQVVRRTGVRLTNEKRGWSDGRGKYKKIILSRKNTRILCGFCSCWFG